MTLVAGILTFGYCSINVPQQEPASECKIADLGKWQLTKLGGSYVDDPLCPTIVSFHEFPNTFVVNLIANDLGLISGAPGRLAWYNNQHQLIGEPQVQHQFVVWNGDVAQVWGTYFAATDSTVTQGEMYDYGRVSIPRVAFNDSARAEALLRYVFHSQATSTFPTGGLAGQNLSFTVNAQAEFRPISYEWYIDGVLQPTSGPTLAKNFSNPDTYLVRLLVTAADGHCLIGRKRLKSLAALAVRSSASGGPCPWLICSAAPT